MMQGRLVESPTGELGATAGPRWREEFPLAADLGLRHLELVAEKQPHSANPIWTTAGRRELADLAASVGVGLKSLCANEPLATPLDSEDRGAEWARRLTPVVIDLGIEVVVIPLLEASDVTVVGVCGVARAVAALAAPLIDSGARVVLELSLAAGPSVEFLAAAGREELALCYDLGNATAAGLDAPSELRALGDTVGHVHAKDKDADGNNVVFGTGMVPFAAALTALDDVGFDGLVTIEATRGDDPLAIAKQHRAHLLQADRGGQS